MLLCLILLVSFILRLPLQVYWFLQLIVIELVVVNKAISFFVRFGNNLPLQTGLIRWRFLLEVFVVKLVRVRLVCSLLFSLLLFLLGIFFFILLLSAGSEHWASNPLFVSLKIGSTVLNHSGSSVKANPDPVFFLSVIFCHYCFKAKLSK